MTSGKPAGSDALDAILDLSHPRKLAARDWAIERLPKTSDLQDGWVVDRALWKAAADFGVQGVLAPESVGGQASTIVDALLMFEGLGLAPVDNGVIFALASQTMAVQRALADSGTDDQLQRWLAPLVRGEMFGCFAMSEQNAGSDPWAIETTATIQPDGSFVLSGTKTWITLAPLCDMALVFASTDPERGAWGITAFIVDADLPGFERGEGISKVGMKSCPFGELRFNECRVEADRVLGRVGAGAAIFSRVIEAERAFLYVCQLGASERVIDAAIERARTRQQSGTNIGSFQAVSHRIVDMKVQHEAARLLIYKAAALYDRGQSLTLAAALAKLMAAEVGPASALDAIRTFGASGFTTEPGLDDELRDSLAGFAFSGTPDVTRNIVASLLQLNRPIDQTKQT